MRQIATSTSPSAVHLAFAAGTRTSSLQGAERALAFSESVLAAAARSCARISPAAVEATIGTARGELAAEAKESALLGEALEMPGPEEGGERADVESCHRLHTLAQETLERQVAIRVSAIKALASLLAADGEPINDDHWALGDLDFAIDTLRSVVQAGGGVSDTRRSL